MGEPFMINVSNLTKYYGEYPAVRDISFDVPGGQIVGFLGPNGAGKTTTMRILAGYLGATSGQATIDGLDVFDKPVEVRRRIGYMPENCPLYPEMRVVEYLRFRAGIKDIPGPRQQSRIDYVLERCWLADVQRQLIGTLSKGYRQRVGLADALLAEPPVLILDEPTAGLDPTQIRSTRKLIRELGQQHTILLSTHILSEVELVCDSVIIIHRGRVAAAGPLKDLARQAGDIELLAANFDGTIDTDGVRALAGVMDIASEEKAGDTHLRITTADAESLSPLLFGLAVERGWKLKELRPERQTLEDMFVRITEDHGNRKFIPSATPRDERVMTSDTRAGTEKISSAHLEDFTRKD
jgi:ABC-2 type transport system ATP-binding protein